jgi:FAD dependent oxidoreductase TIGR03364
MTQQVDVAIVGAGIIGLAHAWAAAKKGLSVVVVERNGRAMGASVRNFGMIWPIGQPPGKMLKLAMHSRTLWMELAKHAGINLTTCGSLHLAHEADEQAVLEEFMSRAKTWGYDCKLLTPAEAIEKCPGVRKEGLRTALWSTTECCIDPRQVLHELPAFLHKTYGVQFRFNTTITRVVSPQMWTSEGHSVRARYIIVCNGTDFETLFPELLAKSGLQRCKLQMLRTAPQPNGWKLGPLLAGGLTLSHYPTFRDCASMPKLKERIEKTMPDYVKYGIHVMAAQNSSGEVVIGDSHEYDKAIDVFDKAEIEELILQYLGKMVQLPETKIAARWNGIYAKHPTKPIFEDRPQPHVYVRTGPGGAGMTLSMGLADEWCRDKLVPASA